MPRNRRICFVCDKAAKPECSIILHGMPKPAAARSRWKEALKLDDRDNLDSVHVCSRHFPRDHITMSRTPGAMKKCRLLPTACPSLDLTRDINECAKTVEEHSIATTSPIAAHPNQNFIFIKVEDNVKEQELPQDTTQMDVSGLKDISAASSLDDPLEPEIQLIEISNPRTLTSPPPIFPPTSPLTSKRRCFEPRYVSEIETSDVGTPRKAQRVLAMVKQQSAAQKKKIKALQDANRALMKKVQMMENTIEHLKQQHMYSFQPKKKIIYC